MRVARFSECTPILTATGARAASPVSTHSTLATVTATTPAVATMSALTSDRGEWISPLRECSLQTPNWPQLDVWSESDVLVSCVLREVALPDGGILVCSL